MKKNNNNRILFYSSVKSNHLFKLTGFYVQDIKALELAGFKVKATNNPFDFIYFLNYDIGFFYFYKKSFIPAIISRIFNKKILFTGGFDELSFEVRISKIRKRIFQNIFKLCYIISDNCNVVSKSDYINMKLTLNKFPKLSNKKLTFFPHCISIYTEIKPIVKKQKILTTICWMSTIGNVKRKGVDRCLFFLKELICFDDEYRLIIIGSLGEGSKYLKKIINDLNLSKYVSFAGEINENDKLSILNKSKYYLQLSVYEGFGMAVLEAMLNRCFIIHSNVGGLNDTVNTNGFICEQFENFNILIKALLDIDQSTIDKVILANYTLINTNYSLSARSQYFKKIIYE
jgi:glycosyltransferase involved in cell wall biosynthesis